MMRRIAKVRFFILVAHLHFIEGFLITLLDAEGDRRKDEEGEERGDEVKGIGREFDIDGEDKEKSEEDKGEEERHHLVDDGKADFPLLSLFVMHVRIDTEEVVEEDEQKSDEEGGEEDGKGDDGGGDEDNLGHEKGEEGEGDRKKDLG